VSRGLVAARIIGPVSLRVLEEAGLDLPPYRP
jgi:hypothetical protein